MGTSRGYNAPTNGNWPRLKREVAQFGDDASRISSTGDANGLGPQQPLGPRLEFPSLSGARQILASYIRTYGGALAIGQGLSRGDTGSAAGDRTQASRLGQSATRVGRNLGGFATSVRQTGLATTLREFGLDNLIGQPALELFSGLTDALVGPDSTMDDDLAREALCLLRREHLADAQTAEDVERILKETLGRVEVGGLIMQFYGHYLFAMFCRDFYERLQQKIGPDEADRSIASVRRTITATLENKLIGQEVTQIDWGHAEGHELAQRILIQTLEIFEVSE